MPYRLRAGSVPSDAVMLFRTLPAGTKLTVEELAVKLRVRHVELDRRLGYVVQSDYLARDPDGRYSLGTHNPGTLRMTQRIRGPRRTGAEAVGVKLDAVVSHHNRGSLRELMDTGAAIETGNPLRELADLHDAARRVLAAKAVSRFKGAEVDVAVARELRCISQAIAQATANLNRYLEVMS